MKTTEASIEHSQPTNLPKLLRKKEVAEILAVSTRTVDRMAADGTLTKRYIRGFVRFDATQVARLIEKAR